MIAEAFISGQELTVPFLGDQALPVVRIVAPGGNYDYQNKYFTDTTQYFCPSGPAGRYRSGNSVSGHEVGANAGMPWLGGRADLILQEDGRAFLLEMNTSPGMTGHSLVPMSARTAGMDFTALCLNILGMATPLTDRQPSFGKTPSHRSPEQGSRWCSCRRGGLLE